MSTECFSKKIITGGQGDPEVGFKSQPSSGQSPKSAWLPICSEFMVNSKLAGWWSCCQIVPYHSQINLQYVPRGGKNDVSSSFAKNWAGWKTEQSHSYLPGGSIMCSEFVSSSGHMEGGAKGPNLAITVLGRKKGFNLHSYGFIS